MAPLRAIRSSLAVLALSAALALAPATPAMAADGAPAAADVPAAAADGLRLRVVLLRHGVRSPTQAPDALAKYADQAWAAWPVPPGQLTEHGIAAMQALGTWYREQWPRDALTRASEWPGVCGASALTVISDSTPRNHASAAALVRGLQPGCAQAGYRAQAPGRTDPLFSGLREVDKADADLSGLEFPPALAELQQVLLGCTDEACLARAQANGKTVLLDACTRGASTDAGCGAQRRKVLKLMGTLSENLMLEAAQGFAPAQVAWGRADAERIGRLITLHNQSFDYTLRRSRPAAQARAANLLAHLSATLQAAAGQTPAVAPLGGRETRLLMLVGHDSNLATLAGLLGLDWHDARQPDDYPPGGALVFDLVARNGQYSVQVASAMPSLAALRAGRFDAPDAVIRRELTLPQCPGACTLARFAAMADQAVDPREVQAAGNDEPPVVLTNPATTP